MAIGPCPKQVQPFLFLVCKMLHRTAHISKVYYSVLHAWQADFILWVLNNRKKKRGGEFCKLTNTGSSCSGDNTICYQLSSTTITAAGQTGNKSLWIPAVRGCNFAISLLGGFSVVPPPPRKIVYDFVISNFQFNGCNGCNNILFTFLSWGITKNLCNFIF